MLPMLMHFKIRRPGRRGFSLWFPVVLVWILAAALMVLLLPLVLLAALWERRMGRGWSVLLIYPMLASLLWHLGGLRIDIGREENGFSMKFV
ncbi:MAG: hypothetical protein ACYDH0_05815 [Candidatus Aminicenantales bacterium]